MLFVRNKLIVKVCAIVFYVNVIKQHAKKLSVWYKYTSLLDLFLQKFDKCRFIWIFYAFFCGSPCKILYFLEHFFQQSKEIVEQPTACAMANGWSALLTRLLGWKLWPWNINMPLFSHCKWITRALCLRRMGDTADWVQWLDSLAALCGPATF